MTNKLSTKVTKPKVVLLNEEKKLRDYEPEQRLALAKKVCEDLLVLLGVGDNSDPQHHVRTIRFIRDALLNYSPNEIILAFEMFVAGKFESLEPYQQLNSVVVGRVTSRYETWKRNEIDKFKKQNKEEEVNEPPEDFDMILVCDELFKEYSVHKSIRSVCSHVYEFIYSKGLLPKHDKEFRDKTIERATRLAKSEALGKVVAGKLARGYLKHELAEIESGKSGAIGRISKKIILEDYFKELIESNKKITDVL